MLVAVSESGEAILCLNNPPLVFISIEGDWYFAAVFCIRLAAIQILLTRSFEEPMFVPFSPTSTVVYLVGSVYLLGHIGHR